MRARCCSFDLFGCFKGLFTGWFYRHMGLQLQSHVDVNKFTS